MRRKNQVPVFLALVIITTVFLGVNPPSLADDSQEAWWWPTHGEWVETKAILPDEPEENRPNRLGFGGNVVIDGDTLVIATIAHTTRWDRAGCPLGDGCDWVYVYNRGPDGLWMKTQKLVPDDPRAGDSFGVGLALDEESGIIVVGNPGPRVTANEVYIFERTEAGAWEQSARIHKEYTEPHPRGNDWSFGTRVATDGLRVAASDVFNSYVFEKIDGEWTETARVAGSAHGLVINGDLLVTTPLSFDPRPCSSSGKYVHIQFHERRDGDWIPTARLDPQADEGNRTQTSIARIALNEEGTTLATAFYSDRRVYGIHTEHCITADAPGPVGNLEIHAAGPIIGSARVYELQNDQWVLTADLTNPTPDPVGSGFGTSIDMSGDTLVVGVHADPYNNGPGSGTAYIYQKIGGEWLLQARLKNHDSEPVTFFGHAVSISDETVAIGANWNKHDGTVHLFEPLGPTVLLQDGPS